jgi:hypothetical protein
MRSLEMQRWTRRARLAETCGDAFPFSWGDFRIKAVIEEAKLRAHTNNLLGPLLHSSQKLKVGPLRTFIIVLSSFLVASSWAADALIKDGDTLTVSGIEYRLDGIDAPEYDQVCLNYDRAVWKCGIEVRDRLARWIGDRSVRCEDKGVDPVYSSSGS